MEELSESVATTLIGTELVGWDRKKMGGRKKENQFRFIRSQFSEGVGILNPSTIPLIHGSITEPQLSKKNKELHDPHQTLLLHKAITIERNMSCSRLDHITFYG